MLNTIGMAQAMVTKKFRITNGRETDLEIPSAHFAILYLISRS